MLARLLLTATLIAPLLVGGSLATLVRYNQMSHKLYTANIDCLPPS